jgi:hypothetical protein
MIGCLYFNFKLDVVVFDVIIKIYYITDILIGINLNERFNTVCTRLINY